LESEIFPALRVAGIDGQVDALLSDKSLLLERADGKGMRIELDTIVRLRHHHVAITPPLLTLFGVLAVIASFRVLDGRPQVYSFILGAAAILFWALGRRPALCIDTRQGDRHILYGRDHRLQRLYIMVDRMSEGATLEDARLGLDELQQPEFLSIGSIDDIQNELQSVEAAEAQLVGGVSGTSLEEALADLRDHRERAYGAEQPIFDAELFSDDVTSADAEQIPESGVVATASTYSQHGRSSTPADVQTSPTPHYSSPSTDTPRPATPELEGGLPQRSMYGRASRALQEQREVTSVPNHSYDSPFQTPTDSADLSADNAYQRCWGRSEPKWYEEKDGESAPLSRVESAAKEASEANFDTGGMFGIFDQLDDVEEDTGTGQQYTTSTMTPSPTSHDSYPSTGSYANTHTQPHTTLPAPRTQQSAREQPAGGPTSSYSMLSAALGSGNALPEPTREALRPGLPVSSGLVESARISTPPAPQPRPLTRQPKYARRSDRAALDEYPALSRMHRQGVNDSRLRLNKDRLHRRRGAMSTLGQWVRPGLKRLEKKGKEFTKLIIGEASYRETYGDEDGNEGDQYMDAELRTDQILRLRADQDAQSDVAERLKLLTQNGGGAIADDLAARTLRGISDSTRSSTLVLGTEEEDKSEVPSSFNKMLCTSDPTPGFGGMRRLG
jgi:hypothetical protein